MHSTKLSEAKEAAAPLFLREKREVKIDTYNKTMKLNYYQVTALFLERLHCLQCKFKCLNSHI